MFDLPWCSCPAIPVFLYRQVLGGERVAQGARPGVWDVRVRQVRLVQARHPVRHPGSGLPKPCPFGAWPVAGCLARSARPERSTEAIRKAGAKVHEIVLAPLGLDDVGRLVADALHCAPERARPLAPSDGGERAGTVRAAARRVSSV
jgi:hypothetical protein